MYKRLLKQPIKQNFFKGKALIIVGPRQTEKTTLSQELLKEFDKQKICSFNCDNPTDREQLTEKK